MRFYSIIIPVFNRPKEVDELLESLVQQQFTNFEVLIVEDGSTDTCEDICKKYEQSLKIRYFYKENTGQGFSRNYGFERAEGEYFIVFDSDCIIPENYFAAVDTALDMKGWDAYGGPDASMESFTTTQRAISYSMTAFCTTGGIRGAKVQVGTFRPRSFNMGISKAVYEKTGGYIITRMAEDLEFSIRIEKAGFKMGLIPEAKVYHKRRTNLVQFFKQLFFFGRGRVNIFRFYKSELKFVHLFPLLFTIGFCTLPFIKTYDRAYGNVAFGIYMQYAVLVFGEVLIRSGSFKVAFLSIAAAFTQLTAYALGFLTEAIRFIWNPKPSALRK